MRPWVSFQVLEPGHDSNGSRRRPKSLTPRSGQNRSVLEGHHSTLASCADLQPQSLGSQGSMRLCSQANPGWRSFANSTLGLHVLRGITKTFVQRDPVHQQAPVRTRLESADTILWPALVYGLDGVPVHPGESADMADGLQRGRLSGLAFEPLYSSPTGTPQQKLQISQSHHAICVNLITHLQIT